MSVFEVEQVECAKGGAKIIYIHIYSAAEVVYVYVYVYV